MPADDRVRPRGLEAAGAVAGAAALLGGVFWLARGWPSVSPCDGLDLGERRAVDAFRAGAAPLHLLAAGLLLVSLVRLSAARRGRRSPAPTTAVAGAVYTALLAAVLAEPDAAASQSLLMLVIAPLTGVALLAAVFLLVWRPDDWAGIAWVVVAAWLMLVVVVPGHYASVALADEVWFCD